MIDGAENGVGNVAAEKGLNNPLLDRVTAVINAGKDTIESFTSDLRTRQEVEPYTVGLDYIIDGPLEGIEAVTDEQGDAADATIADVKKLAGAAKRQIKGYTQSVDDVVNGPVIGVEEFSSDQGHIIDDTTGDVKEIVGDIV